MLAAVPAVTIRAILAGMRGAGLDVNRIAERCGLTKLSLDDQSRIPDPIYVNMWREARREAQFDAIGAAAGAKVPVGMLGAIDYLASSVDTLGESVLCTRDFHYLLAESSYWDVEVGSAGELCMRYVNSQASEEDESGDEFALGLLVERGLAWACSPAPVVEIQLTRRKPIARLSQQFFSRVSYGHSQSQLVLGKGAASIRLRSADPHLHGVLRSLIQPDNGRRNGTGVADAVRASVRELIASGGSVSITSVSRRLGSSERSLQRRLKQEGTRFEQIVDEMRRALALDRLRAEPERSVLGVALDVGFADERALARAVRRWTGMSPRQWRRAQL